MKLAYLLPCSCGQKVEVDSTQAGLVVNCVCGRTLEVPTMRHLGKLERTGAEQHASHVWGPRQGYTLVGALVALLGLAWLGYQVATMPEDLYVVPEEVRAEVASYEPAELAQQYRLLRVTLDPTEPQVVQASRAYQAWHRRWTYVAGGVALLGLAMAAGAWIGMAPSKTPPARIRRGAP